ncbi:MAG TPA: hypothetical protein VGP25_20360 [Gemmatimonadaceae bacterium]|nr:hypothetical protein [Gemmatimonadaceae bacterium]
MLFAVATTIRVGIPGTPFYSNDLQPQDRARGLAICKAADVASGPLLEACTLDAVVLNGETAAEVFVQTRRPRAVIKPILDTSDVPAER